MKELLISSLLGIVVLALDMFRLRKAILPVILAGLAALVAVVVADWGTQANPFGNNMLLMDEFALASIGVLGMLALSWFAITSDSYAQEKRRTDLYVLVIFSLAGGMILSSYTNLVMMFIGVEILSIPLYVLAASDRANPVSNEAGFKYFFLGSVASATLLFGIALIYGATGTFDFGELTAGIENPTSTLLLYGGATLVFAGFAFKVSAAPFHFWAPDVYQGSPTPVTAFMSSVVKAAGFFALYRLASGPLSSMMPDYVSLFAFLTALTLIVSNVMAAVQSNVKRMLAFSGISHAGFLLAAVMTAGSGDPGVLLFYGLTYGIASIVSFAVLHIVSSFQNGAMDYASFNGLARRNPFLTGAMTLALLSMAGLPPLAGFMAKYFVISSVIQADMIWLAVLMVLTSVVGMYYYLRVIMAMFTPVENAGRIVLRPLVHYAFVILSVLMIALFFGAGMFELIGL
jgi:NADH-quinone oxidoreductase subunit N